MNLIATLSEFDGKRISVLEQLAATLPRNDESLVQFLAIAEHDDANLQIGATWILKRWHEEGTSQIERLVPNIIKILRDAVHWEVQLHLLQILADIPISEKSMLGLEVFVPSLLTNNNKLVRAWALAVLAAIADHREVSRGNVISLLQDSEQDEAASVRARIRQIRKRYKWAVSAVRTEQ